MELLVLAIVIVAIVFFTVKYKVNPVFTLTIAAIVCGFCFGLSSTDILATIATGFGKTLTNIGLVIAFGTVIGTFLEKSGGTSVLANFIIKGIGLKKSPLAINLAGFLVAIPVYCDSGFVILSSLNRALSKKSGIRFMVFTIALGSGLYAAHVFVPPTPGPLAAAAILEVDLGVVLLLGLLVGLCVSLVGYAWALFMGNKLTEDDLNKPTTPITPKIDITAKPSVLQTFLPLLVPLLLIGLKSVLEYPTKPLGEGLFYQIGGFLGNPIVALFIGVLLSFAMVKNLNHKTRQQWSNEAFKQAGSIILITGAGGAFGAILRTLDIENMLAVGSVNGVGGLLLAFGIAAVLKTAQGSSTVAILTTAAIIAPMLTSFGLATEIQKGLCVLAIGAGAMTVSHINDSYFWVVAECAEINLKTALKGHSLATLLQGLCGISLILLLYFIL